MDRSTHPSSPNETEGLSRFPRGSARAAAGTRPQNTGHVKTTAFMMRKRSLEQSLRAENNSAVRQWRDEATCKQTGHRCKPPRVLLPWQLISLLKYPHSATMSDLLQLTRIASGTSPQLMFEAEPPTVALATSTGWDKKKTTKKPKQTVSPPCGEEGVFSP